jgi:hypothetical protein
MKPKLIYSTFFSCIIYATAFAQFTLPAQKELGGSNNDNLASVCLTRDGGFIAGGTSFSDKSFEKSENGRGNGDYWVIKVDSHGNIQWDKTIGGNGFDEFKSVIQTSDGGYALVGSSNSNISFEKTENSYGSSDYWLVKLDKMGNVQWDKTIGGSGDDYVEEIIQTKDDGYILAGSSNSNISADKSANSRGGMDVWVVKLNKYGEKVWDKTFGGNDDDWCSSFAATVDGGVIVCGSSLSNISGEKTENSRGGFDYWLLKLDSKGSLEWDKTVGGNGNEFCQNVFQTADKGYIIAGSSLSGISGEKTESDRGGADYWAVKLDKNRKIEWDKTIGGNGDDWCNVMIQTKSGGYMLAGSSLSSPDSTGGGDKSEYSRGGADYWIVNLNHNGQLLWDKTIGGYYDDWGDAVAELRENEFLIGGFSYSPEGADKTEFNRGDADYWIVQLNYKKHGGTSEVAAENTYSQNKLSAATLFSVYPNPFSNNTNISFTLSQSQKVCISIFNINGKLITTLADAQMEAGTHQLTWNARNENGSAVIAGTYLLKLQAGSYADTKKLVILK